MASNDQWPPVASPSCGKNHNKGKSNAIKKKGHQQMVLDLVTEMFASTLEQEVILSLAENCNWELQSTIDALIALSATVETPINDTARDNSKIATTIAQTKQYHPFASDQLSEEYLKMDQSELKQQLEEFTKFEQLKKNSTKNRMDSFRGNIAKLDSCFNDHRTNIKKEPIPSSPWNSVCNSNKRNKAKVWENTDVSFPSNLPTQSIETASNKLPNVSQSSSCNIWQTTNSFTTTPMAAVRPNPLKTNQTPKASSKCYFKTNKLTSARQLCGLQVHYRSPGTESSSDDDDADVVIEEEFNDYSIPTEISVNVSQFLSSSVQTSPPSTQSYKSQVTATASPSSTPESAIYNATLDRIKAAINRGDKILIILRGLPGSGKSSLAKGIVTMTGCKGDPSLYIFSSDDYFRLNNRGLYTYDPAKLSDAHSLNHRRVLNALKSSTSPVIVDNTNLQAWEMRPYASMAIQRGYYVEVLDLDTPWANNINELAKKNTHGVLKDKIAKMQIRYERGISGQKLLELYSLKYQPDISSQKIDIINEKDVLTAEDMAVLQNIDQIPNAVHDEENPNESNMNRSERANSVLSHCLKKLTNDKTDKENEQKKITMDINYLLQPLGAIGSERKNSLVHSESISLPRDVKSDSGRDSKENFLSQCWDFTLSLNGETLHSDHHDNQYYYHNPRESPINADELRKQDKEFGKEEQCVTVNPSLLTKPMMNLSQLNYNNFESNDMNEFFNALSKEYNDAVTSFEQKKSTVIITEISEDVPSSEVVVENEKSSDRTTIRYHGNITKIDINNDTEQFENIPITLFVSIEEMKYKDCDNLRMLSTNDRKSKLGTISNSDGMKDFGPTDKSNSGKFNEMIVNEQFKHSLTKPSFVTFFDTIKTSILESNTTVAKHALEIEHEKVHGDDIYISTVNENTGIINNESATKDKQQEMLPNHRNYVANDGDIVSTNQGKYCPDIVQKLILNDNTVIQCAQTSKSNEQIHIGSDITDFFTIPENNPRYQEFDNINRITWKESPFPLDDISITELVREINITPGRVPKVDASTNTTYYDFNVAYVGGTSEPGYRVIDTFSRHIYDGLPVMNLEQPPLKLMLHKSSMTGDIFNREGNPDMRDDDDNADSISKLIELFPHIPRDCLMEIYEKLCMKDFDWTIEMLLDGVPNDVTIKAPDETNLVDCKISRKPLHVSNQPTNINSDSVEGINYFLEDNLEHTENQNHQQQYLQYHQYQGDEYENATDEKCLNDMERLNEAKTNICDNVSLQSAVLENPHRLSDNEKSSEPEETIELNLGCEFVRTLEYQFGNPEFQIPDGFQPIIYVKKSIAEQLYALWIESMYQQLNVRHGQLDQMIAKDAEFAKSLERELQLDEAPGSKSDHSEHSVPNLNEIMDMELALASYKNDLKSTQNKEIPDDMAARLSRQMLYQSMPDMDPETFNDILKAHNGNFKETFDIIELNTGRSITPCDTSNKSVHNQLLEQTKVENFNGNVDIINSKSISPIIAVQSDNVCNENKSPYRSALIKAANSRQEAQRQFSLRIDNFNKAAEAYRRGYPQVAAYYSQVARLHSKNVGAAHNDAANALVEGQILGDNENTLDLHYLFVAEALQALDKFLDYHFSKLTRSSRKKSSTVYIITGRGARSNNGTSKIKPAISKRLLSRNIRFIEENPGCLKVNLCRKNGTSD